MEFDIATLIQEIKSRKPLWQRDNYNRSCRDVINNLWNEVATKMGVPKELVKTKWKGLRDNFRSELRKIPKKRNHLYQSKWIYFSDMMFIKDQMTSRSSDTSCIVTGDAENVDIDVDVYTLDDSDSLSVVKVNDTKNDKSRCAFMNFSELVSTSSDNRHSLSVNKSKDNYLFHYDNTAAVACSDSVTPHFGAVPFKRTESNCSLNGDVGFSIDFVSDQEISSKRRKLDGSNNFNLHNDDDFYFLMSFLPAIKTLPPDKRMFLRFKIQCLVYNEVYSNAKK